MAIHVVDHTWTPDRTNTFEHLVNTCYLLVVNPLMSVNLAAARGTTSLQREADETPRDTAVYSEVAPNQTVFSDVIGSTTNYPIHVALLEQVHSLTD